jgi:isochorismate synthase
MGVFKHLANFYNVRKPFAVYRKSNSDTIVGIFQNSTRLYLLEDFTEQGFVIAPFCEGKQVYIPLKESTVLIEKVLQEKQELSELSLQHSDLGAKAKFEQLVERCIAAINSGMFVKVVPSRKETINAQINDIVSVFKKLIKTYPTAFCSIFYHPEIGLWIGATPERLLQIKDNTLYTMALAGTQLTHDMPIVEWGSKEKEEQQFVTDFIVQTLKPFADKIWTSQPYTKKAAKVMHICTDIEVGLSTYNFKSIIKVLHPTPAVCGMPKETARDFLIQEEGYDRKYYAGYLGELNCNVEQNTNDESDLYVNLRCMEIEQNNINIYVGCGVTKDSNPESEFFETVNKSSTMKQILNN